MGEVLFIRHGATAGNLQRRYIGRTNEPLSLLGEEQIRRLSKCALSADHLFTSPALRTKQSAEILFPDKPVREIAELWETDFGCFEGKNAEELANDATYRQWVESGCVETVPGGESAADMKERCRNAFQQVMETIAPDKRAAFVIHGGPIMAIMEEFARPKKDFYYYHIPNGGYIRCLWNGTELTVLEIWIGQEERK